MLENKVAVVTGAAKGIGRAIAFALASEGAMVIVNYRGSHSQAEETVKEIEAAGGKAEAYPCDVAGGPAVEAFFSDILNRYGRVDILVNNAGVTRDGLLMRMSDEDWDQVLDANLKGAFHCCKWAAKAMLKQKSGRQYRVGFRRDGKCRSSQLQRLQGRADRPDQVGGAGALLPRDHGERRGAWLH